MIYFVIGVSGSGKTACMEPLKKLLPDYAIYDFDDSGVPENADKKWRQESTEAWIKQLTAQDAPMNSCLLGQMVPGEILASPSVNKLKSFNILLLDCNDTVRIQRLKKRNTYGINQDSLNWAAWLRMHCANPRWEQHVIKQGSSTIMHFDEWDSLQSWNEKTSIKLIDTSQYSIEQVASRIASYIKSGSAEITIKPLTQNDIQPLSNAFTTEGFYKTPGLFEQYYQEQNNNKRSVWIAIDHSHHYLGYITIVWNSTYPYFSENNIPEINDLNVIPSQHQQGIGTKLLEFAENIARQQYDEIGLGVGLNEDYGPAQSLYVKRGYVPNKKGITYNCKNVIPDNQYPIDDDCLLWLTKDIRGKQL